MCCSLLFLLMTFSNTCSSNFKYSLFTQTLTMISICREAQMSNFKPSFLTCSLKFEKALFCILQSCFSKTTGRIAGIQFSSKSQHYRDLKKRHALFHAFRNFGVQFLTLFFEIRNFSTSLFSKLFSSKTRGSISAIQCSFQITQEKENGVAAVESYFIQMFFISVVSFL